MGNNTGLNLRLIAENCGLFNNTDLTAVTARIDALKEQYSQKDLITIYNYLLLNAVEPDVIMYLIRCVDMYRDPSSLEVLVDILLLKNGSYPDESVKEKFVNVRVMCAKAIANQKNTDVVSSLLYCLNNKNEHYKVRLACADSLGRIGDRFAVAPLIDVVKDEDEKSVYLRETAVSALGLLGDARALDPIVSILETKQGIINKFTFLKERAIEALMKMGFGEDERVFKALKNSRADESVQIRRMAGAALRDSDHPKAFETIKKVLFEDEDIEVRKNAMIALYNMSDRSILDEVINSPSFPDVLKMEAVGIIEEYENDEEDE